MQDKNFVTHCPACGTPAKEQARFCTHCGKPLGAVSPEENVLMSRCPKCGYKPTAPSRFCIQCGTSLVVETPPQPQSEPKQTEQQTCPPQQNTTKQAAPQSNPPQQNTARQAAPQTPPSPQNTAPAGQPHQQYAPQPQYYGYQPGNIVQTLCSKLRVSAILLLITGCLQAIVGIIVTIIGIVLATQIGYISRYAGYYGYRYYQDEVAIAIVGMITLLVIGVFVLVTCIFNFVGAGRTFQYIKQIQQYPVGIVAHFMPSGKTIGLLILNILWGGVIGIIGSVFALVARSFVQNNSAQFMALEQDARH